MGHLYTKLKVFHFKDKIDSLPEERRETSSPVHIRIKPTNACNHNCRYCAYRVDDMQLGQDMLVRDFIPRDKMMEIIEDLSEMGVRAVTFSGGGEPLCYPYFADTLKAFIKTKIKFACLTNGSRLHGEVAELFSRYGTWIRVSMDGWDDESYSTYRKVPSGEFTKVIDNIERFKRLGGMCYLGVSYIVDRRNAPHVYEFLKLSKNTGANSVKISPCIVSNSGAGNNEYHKPIFNLVKEQVEKALSDLAGKDFEIFDAYHELDEKFEKTYTWCPYLQILPVIGADLNIYSCQDKAYNLEEGLVGSIKTQRFKDFWFSDKKKFFKINPSKVCNHHCVANEKNKLILDYLSADSRHLDFV